MINTITERSTIGPNLRRVYQGHCFMCHASSFSKRLKSKQTHSVLPGMLSERECSNSSIPHDRVCSACKRRYDKICKGKTSGLLAAASILSNLSSSSAPSSFSPPHPLQPLHLILMLLHHQPHQQPLLYCDRLWLTLQALQING